ncbi:MAG TPA: hypothetical protein VGH73_21465 [Thermoanaerobaculia bacterium]
MEADGRPSKKSSSPWLYVGLGCGAAVLLGLFAISGFTYFMYRQGKNFAEGFKNPKVREQRTREILPYKELPAGYYPAGAFSVPLLMDFTVLSDRPPTGDRPEQGFDQRTFVFMNMRHLRNNREKMERFLRGEAPAPEDSSWKSNVNFKPKELIGRGTIKLGDMAVLYAANRGEVSHKGGETREGIVTMVLPECPDDRLRFGLWVGPDPQAATPVAAANYSGTPADPQAIRDFLDHFQLCGGKN